MIIPKTRGKERSIKTVNSCKINRQNIVNLICFEKWIIKLNNFSGGTTLLPNLIGSVILSKKLSLCLEKVFIDYNKITTNEFNFNIIENNMKDRFKSILITGCSSGIGFMISLSGAIGFFISGFYLNVDLPLSIGFINIPAFLIFIPITTFMARVGANTTHRMDKVKVQRLFGVFLYVIGTIFLLRFLGI